MKTLFVLRHGQAVPESEAASDHDRELTSKGRDEVRRASEVLAERATPPTLVLSSSAARARQSAELCMDRLAQTPELKILDGLYLAEPPSYLAALGLRAEPHAAVLVVGHNPGLEALVYVLTERSEHLATASLVEITLSIDAWAELSGRASPKGKVAHTFRA